MGLKIVAEVQGREASLSLTDEEVETAKSILKRDGLKELVVMKKEKGGACFYTNSNAAAHAQERHGFDYAFTLTSADLSKAAQQTTEKKG